MKQFIHLTLFFLISTLQAADLWDYNLMTHSDITWTERNEEYLYKYVGENVAKRNQSLFYQISSPVAKQETKWSFVFQSKHLFTPQEAKVFATKVHKDLMHEIQRNKETIKFLTQDLDALFVPPSYVALKITFYNKDRTPAAPPHVARVFLTNNQIFYNLLDPEYGDLSEPIALK